MPFIEPKVVGVDEIRTHQPDPENPIYNVYFELSVVPSIAWKKIFELQSSPRFLVDGRHIVVRCVFSEIENMLEDVRREVVRANQEYRKNLSGNKNFVLNQKMV